jgi:hypothetical protein
MCLSCEFYTEVGFAFDDTEGTKSSLKDFSLEQVRS